MHASMRLSLALLAFGAVIALRAAESAGAQAGRLAESAAALRGEVMATPGSARAQQGGLDFLRERITLDLRSVTVEEALNEVARLGNVQLVYSRELLPPASRRVDLLGARTVGEAFAAALEGTDLDLLLRPSGHAVLVARRQTAETPESVRQGAITGRVTSADGGQPVAGATVSIEGTRRSTRSTASGRYLLTNVAPGTYRIIVESLGMRSESREVTVRAEETLTLDFVLQVQALPLAAVVVTGTVVPTEVREIPTPITVVTSEQIERLNSQNVAEIFRSTVPGAVYTSDGPAVRYGSFSVRGVSALGEASTLKIYIDGVEVSDPAYVTNLDPSIIERIEVLSGPQASTIYGSRAISGVMQVFTKRPRSGALTRPEVSGKVAMQTVASPYVRSTPTGHEFAISLSGGTESFGYNVGVGIREEPEWVDLLKQQNRNLFTSLRFAHGRFHGDVTVRRQQGYDEPFWNPLYRQLYQATDRPDNPPADVYDSDLETYGIRLGFDASDRWTHNFTAGFDGFERHWYTRQPGADSLYPVRLNDTYRRSFAYNTTMRLDLGPEISSTVTLGADQSRYGLDSYGTVRVKDWRDYERPPLSTEWRRESTGYFGQAQIGYRGAVYLTAGLRGDRYPAGSNIGTTWSPRIGLTGLKEFGTISVKPRFAWGQAVIVPDERAVGGDDSPSSLLLPSPDLRAQLQRGYDTGFDVFFGETGSIGITYFDQDPLDLIELVRLGTDTTSNPARAIYQYQNLNRVKNRGWELKAEAHPLPRLSLSANFGRTVSTVRALDASYTGSYEVGDELPGRPSFTASGAVTFRPVDGTVISADVVRFGSWEAADFYGYLYDVYTGNYNAAERPYPAGYQIDYPAFTKINMGVSQDVGQGITAFLHVHNLTNDDSFERLNMTIPQPRTVTFGLRLSGL